MRRPGAAVLPVLLALVFASCGEKKVQTVESLILTQSAVSVAVEEPEFSDTELARLDEIRAAGGLRASVVLWPGITDYSDGDFSGFHYDLFNAVVEYLDLPVSYSESRMEDLFSRDGTLPPDYWNINGEPYVPDVFLKSDIVVFDLSPLPWRSRLMTIIPVLPARNIIICRESMPIVQLGDLAGRRGLVYGMTSHQSCLERLNEQLGLGMEINTLMMAENDMEKLLDDEGDFCLRHSAFVLGAEYRNYTGLDITMTFGPLSRNGWAVGADDNVLAGVFTKAVAYLEETGIYNDLFQKAYGITFRDYSSLIRLEDRTELVLDWREQARLREIRRSGGLKVAIYDEKSVYEVDDDGRISGLHYNQVLALAELLDVPVEMEPVQFSEFFRKDGKVDDRLKTDPSFSYRPDLFNRVDLYAGTLTRLPWREKFLLFVDNYPTRMVYILDQGKSRPDPASMDGMSVSLLSDSSYETWARENLPLDRMEVHAVSDGREQTRFVVEGMADFTIMDANLAFTRLAEYPELTFYPATDRVDTLAWATAREDEVLAGIIEKAMDIMRKERTFGVLWEAYYGISFDEYLRLLSLQD